MKILMLLRNEFINDHRVKKEAESLSAHGHEVTILAELCHNTIPEHESYDNISIVRIPVFSRLSNTIRAKGKDVLNQEIEKKSFTSKFLMVSKNNKIRKYLLSRRRDVIFYFSGKRFAKTNKFDVVHAHDLDTLRLGHFISKKQNIPLIYDSHELWQSNNFVLQKNFLSRRYLRWLEMKLITKATRVISTTDSRAEALQKLFNIPKPETIMNIPRYQEIQHEQDYFREKLNIPSDENIVLYQGNISRNRGVYQLIEATIMLKKVRLVFIGMGDEVENLKFFIKEHALENRVYVLPAIPVAQLLKCTASADIGVATYLNSCQSYYLCVPNKVFEIMMAGIPLIMSNFPEYKKIASQADIGEIVDPENPSEIAQAIRRLLGNPERLTQIRNNCRELTQKKYNWERQESKLLSLYDDLIGIN